MNSEDKRFTRIFRRGSRTYFGSARFFPGAIRRDITTLYAYVRTADDFVDRTPQDRQGFEAFRAATLKSRENRTTAGNPIIDRFLELAQRRNFEPRWVDAFLESMSMDLVRNSYLTLEETLAYVYGSAEVIGLMMSAIMGLDPEAYPYARMLGRSMQYINFIRDIEEDRCLGRTYLPAEEWRKFGLSSLNESEARNRRDAFESYIQNEVHRYRLWQKDAERGYRYIPWRYLVPIRTSADMYAWTAEKIAVNPLVIFSKKIRPSRWRILGKGIANSVRKFRFREEPINLS